MWLMLICYEKKNTASLLICYEKKSTASWLVAGADLV